MFYPSHFLFRGNPADREHRLAFNGPEQSDPQPPPVEQTPDVVPASTESVDTPVVTENRDDAVDTTTPETDATPPVDTLEPLIVEGTGGKRLGQVIVEGLPGNEGDATTEEVPAEGTVEDFTRGPTGPVEPGRELDNSGDTATHTLRSAGPEATPEASGEEVETATDQAAEAQEDAAEAGETTSGDPEIDRLSAEIDQGIQDLEQAKTPAESLRALGRIISALIDMIKRTLGTDTEEDDQEQDAEAKSRSEDDGPDTSTDSGLRAELKERGATSIEDQREEIKDLREQAESNLEKTNEMIDETDTRIDELQTEKDTVDDQIQGVRKQLIDIEQGQSDGDADKLRGELRKLERKSERLQKLIDKNLEHRRTLVELKKKIEKSISLLDALEKKLDSLENTLDKVEQALQEKFDVTVKIERDDGKTVFNITTLGEFTPVWFKEFVEEHDQDGNPSNGYQIDVNSAELLSKMPESKPTEQAKEEPADTSTDAPAEEDTSAPAEESTEESSPATKESTIKPVTTSEDGGEAEATTEGSDPALEPVDESVDTETMQDLAYQDLGLDGIPKDQLEFSFSDDRRIVDVTIKGNPELGVGRVEFAQDGEVSAVRSNPDTIAKYKAQFAAAPDESTDEPTPVAEETQETAEISPDEQLVSDFEAAKEDLVNSYNIDGGEAALQRMNELVRAYADSQGSDVADAVHNLLREAGKLGDMDVISGGTQTLEFDGEKFTLVPAETTQKATPAEESSESDRDLPENATEEMMRDLAYKELHLEGIPREKLDFRITKDGSVTTIEAYSLDFNTSLGDIQVQDGYIRAGNGRPVDVERARFENRQVPDSQFEDAIIQELHIEAIPREKLVFKVENLNTGGRITVTSATDGKLLATADCYANGEIGGVTVADDLYKLRDEETDESPAGSTDEPTQTTPESPDTANERMLQLTRWAENIQASADAAGYNVMVSVDTQSGKLIIQETDGSADTDMPKILVFAQAHELVAPGTDFGDTPPPARQITLNVTGKLDGLGYYGGELIDSIDSPRAKQIEAAKAKAEQDLKQADPVADGQSQIV